MNWNFEKNYFGNVKSFMKRLTEESDKIMIYTLK